jgi:poly(beta-D-mannuronate) lyase
MHMLTSRFTPRTARRLLAPALLGLAMFGSVAQAAGLVPPQGYYDGIEKPKKGGDFDCPAAPTPYTGSLQFRSKYEGSDKARSTLNEVSEKAFRDSTKDITTLERGVSKQVMQYMRDGKPAELDCTLNWLSTWADANALMSKDFNHTGKSMRKWALGSMSSSYLRLKFSQAHPLQGHEAQTQKIEAWFSRMADQVVSDWSNLPLEKINNHSYWAAWSVMATAIVTDRRELFDWSIKEFKVAANQIDAQGFLPNELKRKQRALAYHNYALPPLAMIASFAQANGVDLRPENNGALKRLGDRVLEGIKEPEEFEQRNGEAQDMTDLKIDSKYAWLEPYCSLYDCSPDTITRKREMEPFKTFRLGGDLTRTFDPQHEKGEKGGKGNKDDDDGY